jgi:hypothetical protein
MLVGDEEDRLMANDQIFQAGRHGTPSVAVDPDAPSKVILTIELHPRSGFPAEWKAVFDRATEDGVPLSMSPPRLQGYGGTRPRVIVECEDSDMEAVVKYIDARIKVANEHYRTEVYPALQAKKDSDFKHTEERGERLKELQARMDKMGPPGK